MNYIYLIFVLNLFSYSLSASLFLFDDDLEKNKKESFVNSSFFLVGGATYYYLDRVWWSENNNQFSFSSNNDFVYAKNLDKAGHFYGGYFTNELFNDAFIWADSETPLKLALRNSIIIQSVIETKDAYSPNYGFSIYDLFSGIAGSYFHYFKKKSNKLNHIDIKFSYYKRSNKYWQLEKERGKSPSNYEFFNDYVNQTYWLTYSLNKILDFDFFKNFNFAVGTGLDDSQYINNLSMDGGSREYYISLDYNLKHIFRKSNNKFIKNIIYYIDYFKLPSPTFRFVPSYKLHVFYF